MILRKIIGHDEIIERAYKELNRFSWNEEELLTYEQAEKYEGAYLASMAQKFDEGKRDKQIEIARAMLLKKIDIEIIVGVVGLSIEDLKKLKMELTF